MIELEDVAIQLENLLNSAEGFEQYEFNVETTGFHLDHIYNKETGKNFIPVFLSTMGGQHNPVPNLKQTDANIQVTFYYPVRFKKDFFRLNDFLINTFVGKFIAFGQQKARCNISLPQYGEIQDLDLNEFKKWVDQLFHKTISVMEPYQSMTITLYMATVGSDFIWGDNVKISQIQVYNGTTKILDDENPVILERADIETCENASQQALDEKYIKGYPANLGVTKEIPLMVKNNKGYADLIKAIWKDKDTQTLKVTLVENMPFDYGEETTFSVTETYYISNATRKTAYGSLFAISLTLTPLRS